MLRFLKLTVLFTSFYLFAGFSCNKNSDVTNAESNSPDPKKAYVRYTLSNGAGNPLYVNATSTGFFYLYAPSGDTSSVAFNFSNDKLLAANPSWNLCTSNYNGQGKDFFSTFFLWTGSPVKALTAGRTYNLNSFESSSPLPIAQTIGIATYRHADASGTTLESWNTMNNALGSTGRSFIKIDKVENNTVSGSFQLVFTCQQAGSGSLNVNFVTGTFNKIPVTQ